jgi:hypothetical protein
MAWAHYFRLGPTGERWGAPLSVWCHSATVALLCLKQTLSAAFDRLPTLTRCNMDRSRAAQDSTASTGRRLHVAPLCSAASSARAALAGLRTRSLWLSSTITTLKSNSTISDRKCSSIVYEMIVTCAAALCLQRQPLRALEASRRKCNDRRKAERTDAHSGDSPTFGPLERCGAQQGTEGKAVKWRDVTCLGNLCAAELVGDAKDHVDVRRAQPRRPPMRWLRE